MLSFSFQELLIIFSVTILFVTLTLFYVSRKRLDEDKTRKASVLLQSSLFQKTLYGLHVVFLAIFLIITGYSVWSGLRPQNYYFVLIALFVTSTFLLLTGQTKKKSSLNHVVLGTVIILALAQCLLPSIENRYILFGADQWTYLTSANAINHQGSFFGVAPTGGYYTIPLLSILNAAVSLLIGSISSVTGSVSLSFTILLAVMSLIMVLSIYLAIVKITKSELASLVAVFVFLSTPRLAMVQEIPSILSLALGALLVLLTVEYLSFARRSTLVYLLVVAFSTLVFHTAGIIITILFCAGLFAVYLIGLGRPGYIKTRRIRTLLAALCLMSLTYWTFTGNLLSFLLNPLRNLVKIVVSSPTVSSSSYTAPYSGQGFEIFSYAWALPVGISAAYFLLVGYKYFKNGKHSFAKKNSSHILPFVAATCGLILLLISFVFVVNSGGGATERWLDVPAYFLLLIPAAFACAQLIKSSQPIVCLCIVFLLSAGLFVGSAAPDWAPFENSTFRAVHLTYTGCVEANTMIAFVENNSILFQDNDITVTGVAALSNIVLTSPSDYSLTLNITTSIKNGQFSEYFSSYASLHPNSKYVIKISEITNSTVIDNYMNTLYDSNLHLLLKASQ
jgi:hypothetical protein